MLTSESDSCRLLSAAVTPTLALTISGRLNEALPIPHYFDVLAFDWLTDEALRAEITRTGRQRPLNGLPSAA